MICYISEFLDKGISKRNILRQFRNVLKVLRMRRQRAVSCFIINHSSYHRIHHHTNSPSVKYFTLAANSLGASPNLPVGAAKYTNSATYPYSTLVDNCRMIFFTIYFASITKN